MKVLRTPGLYGIEVWRGIAGGVPLSHFRGRTAEYFTELRAFLLRLHSGKAAGEEEEETQRLRQAEGFERLVLCGGGALDPVLPHTLRAETLPFVVEIDRSGPYAARRGALQVFAAMDWRRGVALDLGQLQLKVITANFETLLPRDLSQLPFGADALTASLGRARLRSMIADGLSRVTEAGNGRSEQADGVVLALPVALRGDGVAEPATYPGLFGPLQPIFSDLFPCPSVAVNDAVLTGLGFPPSGDQKTLIVTLGFGLGAALWTALPTVPGLNSPSHSEAAL